MSLFALVAAALVTAPAPPPPAPAPVVPPRLVAPLDLPPAPPPLRRDTTRTVLVQLTVGVDGVPSDLASAPEQGDRDPTLVALALEALARARFTPATRDGQPIVVRVTVPVTLGAATASATTTIMSPRREPEPTPTFAEGVVGRVLERGTRRAVAGVAVVLEPAAGATELEPAREALTDADGAFVFRDVPRGRYRVAVPFFDDDTAVELSPPARVTLRITPDALGEYRTRVGRSSSVTDSARVRVPVERAREIPGSSGDPLKVLEVLPGVARPAAAGPGAGELSVRGSAPEDTRLFVDGLPLFQLYHFGNAYSVLQDAWIDAIDFRAGGFSTGFGDGIGGLVDVTLAPLATDAAHGHVDLNIYHVGALVTVPLSDCWTLGAAVRRSWVDAILGAVAGDDVGFATAPRYYDYQLRADYRGRGARLRLLGFGSDDEVVVLGGGDADDPDGGGFALGRSFHQVQGTLEVDLERDLALSLGLATSYQRLVVSPGDDRFALTFDPVTLRADLEWRASEAVRIRGGAWAELTRFAVALELPSPTKEGEVALPSDVQEVVTASEDGLSGRLDAWSEISARPLDELTLGGGVRLASWHGNFSAFAPDLRLAARWSLAEPTALTISGGLVHQAPAPDESARSIGSRRLVPERAAYVDVALEQRFGDVLGVELQAFAKSLDHLVVRTPSGAAEPYDNAGTGTILGGEVLVRLQHPIVDAWLAYTLSRSRRVDRPGEAERFFSFDQTHVLALVAGVQLGAGWRFGTRVRYATGNPFTPLEPAYFDAGADVWVPRAAAAPLSARSDAFFQLDLRIDKTILFDAWRLDLYLEVANTTNRANIEAIRYSDDYRRREDITSLPLTPSLGIRGSF